MQELTYAELFAGAGGLSMGLEAAGFHAIAHAEIEPHARAVLRHRWPETRLDGDVTQINGADYSGCTLLSGGSPCQDLSVAGKRAGLGGARSGLFYDQVRTWNESGAPYLLWENVAGALSSNHGKDFAAVLSALVGATITVPADGWRGGGVAAGREAVAAWRVLDLQHFGPPQRRVRVFVLAARTGGVDPAQVLALGEGVCGHSSPRSQAREKTPVGLIGRFEGGSVGTLETRPQRAGAHEAAQGHVIAFGANNSASQGDSVSEDGTGRGTPIVVPTLSMGAHTAGPGSNGQDALQYAAITTAFAGRPRRLTPKECERLMGWPDDHTSYGTREDGTVYELSDTARYRLCGNGVGSVQVQWIAERLAAAVTAQQNGPLIQGAA
ncbi:MAG: DNA cytosine methyltransferase [Gemmatimonas sp.]|nr:DNA cytosine methyltransferase [Gemmatimonas sp.]